MWSGPRTLSTALMRSFENRPDTVVVDEPLYGYYLAETGIDHPGRDEILASMPADWPEVIDELTSGPLPAGRTVYYQKHMTHHLLPEHRQGPAGRAAARVPDQGSEAAAGLVRQGQAHAHAGGPGPGAAGRDLPAVRRAGDRRRRSGGARRARRSRRSAPRCESRSMRPCCPGPPGRGRPTACGRSTGTRGYGRRPGSLSGRTRPVLALLAPGTAGGLAPLPAELEDLAARCQPFYAELAAHRLNPAI